MVLHINTNVIFCQIDSTSILTRRRIPHRDRYFKYVKFPSILDFRPFEWCLALGGMDIECPSEEDYQIRHSKVAIEKQLTAQEK